MRSLFSLLYRRRLLVSLLHGFWMIFLSLIWIRQPMTFDYEFEATKDVLDFEYYSRFKTIKGKENYKDRFLFINTAHSLEVYDSEEFESNVRTNREQLLKVLKQLNINSNKFEVAILDLHIEHPESPIDEEITEVVSSLKRKNKIVTLSKIVTSNKISSFSRNNKDSIEISNSIFGNKLHGSFFYKFSNSDAFYKFDYTLNIRNDKIKQAPLLAYECITNKKSNSPFFFNLFYTYNGIPKLFQNTYIPKMVLGFDDLSYEDDEQKNIKTNIVNLDSVAEVETYIADKINKKCKKNSIIIIGDYLLGDSHYTTSGLTRGSLLIANTLIALLEGNNQFSLWYLFFLIFSFSLVSYYTFYPNLYETFKSKEIKNKYIRTIVNLILDDINYVILIIATFVGIYLFDHYIFILFFTIYIWILERLMRLYTLIKKKHED